MTASAYILRLRRPAERLKNQACKWQNHSQMLTLVARCLHGRYRTSRTKFLCSTIISSSDIWMLSTTRANGGIDRGAKESTRPQKLHCQSSGRTNYLQKGLPRGKDRMTQPKMSSPLVPHIDNVADMHGDGKHMHTREAKG